MTKRTEREPLELVRLAAGFLAERGVPHARLDAEVLLAHVLGVPRLQIYLDFEKPLEASEVEAYRGAVRRRGRREPLAHVTGSREFWSLEFRVDARVLIPRPETETLVEACLARMGGEGRILDLGTGSGAVALALLSERPGWSGVGVDTSSSALGVARENAAKLGLGSRLELVAGDLFVPVAGTRFQVIASNPPYVPTDQIDRLDPEVRCDPREALDGGPDGLDVIRRIAAGAPSHLAEEGFLAVEFGADQGDSVEEIFRTAGAYGRVELLSDYAGRLRVVAARKG